MKIVEEIYQFFSKKRWSKKSRTFFHGPNLLLTIHHIPGQSCYPKE
jgi:hypothetical protein